MWEQLVRDWFMEIQDQQRKQAFSKRPAVSWRVHSGSMLNTVKHWLCLLGRLWCRRWADWRGKSQICSFHLAHRCLGTYGQNKRNACSKWCFSEGLVYCHVSAGAICMEMSVCQSVHHLCQDWSLSLQLFDGYLWKTQYAFDFLISSSLISWVFTRTNNKSVLWILLDELEIN